MWIVAHRNIFYGISVALIALSLVVLLVWGLKFGIDFTGGSLIEVQYISPAPQAEEIYSILEGAGVEGSSVRPTGETGYLIRTPFLSPDVYQDVRIALTNDGAWTYEEKRFDSIGPTIGSELQSKSVWAIVLVIITIALFIAFAFRKVSKPVSSWKYGLIALVALAHDVIIPIGAFALFGHFLGAEVDTLFVTAILVVLGFSIHDTIVVFDRVRENLRINEEKNIKEPFDEVIGRSISQTIARSINTSLTTVLALIALYIFGPEISRFFVLALIIGIVAGTYSSIFIASPLLVTLQRLQKEKPVEPKKK